MIGEAVGKVIELVGVVAILATLIITAAIWLFYDYSELQAPLSAEETAGVFIVSLFVVSVIRQIYTSIKAKRKI